MKQRLSVRAIIIENGKALLLKRRNGRPSILGKYELPGGKLAYGEQPEDALRRYLHDDAGLHIQSSQLFDAVTYIDHDNSEIQYGVMVYLVTLAAQRHPMKLSGNYSKYKWHPMSNIQQDELTDLTQLLLGIIHQEEITDKTLARTQLNVDKNTSKKGEENEYKKADSASGDAPSVVSDDTVIAYSDGGSRGNPGPSAAGFVLLNTNNDVIAQGGEYLGITTNNQAEYHGVRLGLEKARELGYANVDFRVDSMLVVNQMKGLYKIKNRELWPINERIRELMLQFNRVTFTHVSRQFNQLADGMVNKTLDEHARSAANQQQEQSQQ